MNIDKKDMAIMGQLIKDPRLSDNQIAKRTSIPVKTVSRRRERLEKENVMQYMLNIDQKKIGDERKRAIHLFILTFRKGISKVMLAEKLGTIDEYSRIATKHIHSSHLAEKDSRVVLVLFVESREEEDLGEIMNIDLVPYFERRLGNGAIEDIEAYPIRKTLRVLHNYIPEGNMKKGILEKNWPESKLYICEEPK